MKAEPRWLELVPGVRWLLSPCSSTVMGKARDSEQVQDLFKDGAEPSETDVSLAMAKAIAELTLVEWEGVCDERDKPLAVTPEAISAALDVFPLFQAFQTQHVAAGLLLVEEKNGYAPSPTGTSAAAGNTARPARRSVKSAPAKSTSRKR
jgi:hypothetical protein